MSEKLSDEMKHLAFTFGTLRETRDVTPGCPDPSGLKRC